MCAREQEILQQARKVEDFLLAGGYRGKGFPLTEKPDFDQAVGYVLYLIPGIRRQVLTRDLTGAAKQLGFLQGVLWTLNILSLKDFHEI